MKQLNSLMSASVPQSGGCNAFATTGLPNQRPVEGVLRHWRSTRSGFLALVNEQQDFTLREIVSALHKRRIPGSRSALSRFFARHGITFKKKSVGSRAQAR